MKEFNPKQFNFTELLGLILILVIIVSGAVGYFAGQLGGGSGIDNFNILPPTKMDIFKEEEAIVSLVERFAPAVVSIVISKDVPIIEQCFINPFENDPLLNDPLFRRFFGNIQIPSQCQIGIEHKQVGGGTGFIVSSDGLIVTNKHVVLDEKAEYTVITNDGKYYDVEIIDRDPLMDLAIIKIDSENLPTVILGNSENIKVGQTVVAIGNALGEFQNTVSVGIISGLSRTITASGPGIVEELRNIIQTDAAINQGNSGGPLINLKGEVIGVNTAVAQEAQSIGFAIPVNDAKRAATSVKKYNKIIYPFLGVRFVTLTERLAEENELSVSSGAWLKPDENSPPILEDSPAELAGLKEGDIIIKVAGEKISEKMTLLDLLQRHEAHDIIILRVIRGEEEMNIEVTLEEREF